MKAGTLAALAVASLLIAAPGFAAPRTCANKCSGTVLANPDGRTSITVTAGMGNLDGLGADTDLSAVGIGLIYPAATNFSFLANWNHSEYEANHFDLDSDLFTVGVRFYLGK